MLISWRVHRSLQFEISMKNLLIRKLTQLVIRCDCLDDSGQPMDQYIHLHNIICKYILYVYILDNHRCSTCFIYMLIGHIAASSWLIEKLP